MIILTSDKMKHICKRCGEVNPAEIHTCTPKELEYCPHGKYINYSCNDCDAEEHADRMHSYGE